MSPEDAGQERPQETPPSPALAPSPQGGIRGEYTTTWKNSRDVRLAGRALLEDWPNPPEKRAALMQMLYDTALTSGENIRDRLYAANVIAKLHAQNLQVAGVGAKGPDLHIHGDVSQLVLQAGRLLAQGGSVGTEPPESPPLLPVPTR